MDRQCFSTPQIGKAHIDDDRAMDCIMRFSSMHNQSLLCLQRIQDVLRLVRLKPPANPPVSVSLSVSRRGDVTTSLSVVSPDLSISIQRIHHEIKQLECLRQLVSATEKGTECSSPYSTMLRDLIGRDHISSGDRWTGDVSLPSSSNSTSAADSVTRSLDDIAAALLPPVADASADHLRTAADAAIITDQACYEQFLQEKNITWLNYSTN